MRASPLEVEGLCKSIARVIALQTKAVAFSEMFGYCSLSEFCLSQRDKRTQTTKTDRLRYIWLF
jgi:hypothetical protein